MGSFMYFYRTPTIFCFGSITKNLLKLWSAHSYVHFSRRQNNKYWLWWGTPLEAKFWRHSVPELAEFWRLQCMGPPYVPVASFS
ncbi:hypothetical protein NQ318_001592 [Aromia moschata]|uniref:Uncharacterized protein n=1 Tax=Aromia moschata TaxID=1265417 RepID=A0AAV8Y2B2_9CUCU|nr:hypothetical protein NQ318_001592 [Aromia moschata]